MILLFSTLLIVKFVISIYFDRKFNTCLSARYSVNLAFKVYTMIETFFSELLTTSTMPVVMEK